MADLPTLAEWNASSENCGPATANTGSPFEEVVRSSGSRRDSALLGEFVKVRGLAA